jgi:hypothetical protein
LFSEEEEETPKRAKKATPAEPANVPSEEDRSPSPTIEAASPSPEVQPVEPTSGKRRKGKGVSAVAEMDMTPQEITKHGYSEDAFLLNSMIYIGVRVLLFSHAFADPDSASLAAKRFDQAGDLPLVYSVRPHMYQRGGKDLWAMYP